MQSYQQAFVKKILSVAAKNKNTYAMQIRQIYFFTYTSKTIERLRTTACNRLRECKR